MLPNGVKPIQLSNYSDADRVTVQANTVNVMSPVATFTAPRGSEFLIPGSNQVEGVEYPGMFFVIDLRDSAGNKIPPNSSIEIASRNPGKESKNIYRTIKHNLFATLDVQQQQSRDFKGRVQDALALEPGTAGIGIEEQGKFIISVESAVAVDWTKSNLIVYAGEAKPGTLAALRG
jgi:hypothetical protein